MGEFEDGKPVEEYLQDDEQDLQSKVNELDSLVIEPEPSTEATVRIEDVAEPPVRNEKKKPTPKSDSTKPVTSIKAQPSPAIATTQDTVKMQRQTPLPQPIIKPEAEVAPIDAQPELPPPPQEEPQKIITIDDYIEQQGETIRQQYYEEAQKYVDAGDMAKEQFREKSYNNLFAVINGDVALVPVQQLQQQRLQQTQQPQQEQQEPAPQQQTVNIDDELRRIDNALKDPIITDSMRKALLKKKCDLLGIPYQETTTISQPLPLKSNSPVEPKKVKNEPTEKRKGLSMKVILAGISLAALATLAVLLLITQFSH